MTYKLNSLNRFSEKAKEKLSGAKKIIGSVALATALLSTPEAKASNNPQESYYVQHEEIDNKELSHLRDNKDEFIASIPNIEPETIAEMIEHYSEDFEKYNIEINTLLKDNDHNIHEKEIRDLKKAQSVVYANFMREFFDVYGIEQLTDEEYDELQKGAYFEGIPDNISFLAYVQLKYKESNETLFDIE